MRRIIFFVLVLTLVTFGQTNFTFEHQDTSVTGLEDYYQFDAHIINTSAETLHLTANRLHVVEAPTEWSCSMCIGITCLPPFIDVNDFTVEPGDTALFSLDVYPLSVEGTGTWSIVIIDSSTMAADTATYTVTYGTSGINSDAYSPENFNLVRIYPNPTNAFFTAEFNHLTPGNYDLLLYDLQGRLVGQRNLNILPSGTRRISWNANNLTSGNYFLRVTGGGKSWLQRVTVIK